MRAGTRRRLALVTNYYPDRRPLSEYGYHLAHGLRAANRGDVSVLSGRSAAPPDGSLRVWTYGRMSIPLEIRRALQVRPHEAALFNTVFTNWGGAATNLAGMLAPIFAKRLGLTVMILLHHLPQTIDWRRAGYRLTPLHTLAIELACRAMARCDVVCFTLKQDREFFARRYHPSRTELVPLGLQGSPRGLAPPSGRARVLLFGKWGRGKDPEPAIRSFLAAGVEGQLTVAGASSPGRHGFVERLTRCVVPHQ